MHIFLYISILWSQWAANHTVMTLSEMAAPPHKTGAETTLQPHFAW